ncbi:hypothetical protein Clacol_003992 [Clathrus columnatus]|uniref:RRM domain-containing protein n=1 Tax=Clathrus columnatus TaxID=1419009 RepID=A0AAV5A8I8_9AGAM|nr:hypothetical protein Clacol_003992 [Clathrus columnatus]
MPPTPQPHRTWGTRYDSLRDLVSAPSTSPPNVNNTNNPRSHKNDNSMPNTSCIRNVPVATKPVSFPLHNDAVKERVRMQPQHQDDRYSERLPNANSKPEGYSYHNYSNQYSPLGVHARMPHDASVFIASLPSHLTDPELQGLLTEHLNHHATIKHVKLIRDNRNAVCAFVQVQSATQATELIDKCNLSLFMDRQIRCERARAFRTLLVSWVRQEESNHTTKNSPSPQPLRLRRCRGSRFVHVTSGADAFCADPQQLFNYSPPRADDPLCGPGVFFESGIAEGDLESLKQLMEAFGPLEFIASFDPKIHETGGDNDPDPRTVDDIDDTVNNDHRSVDSTPKDSIGHENLDGIWAIKWEHRNDAVSAVTVFFSLSRHCPRIGNIDNIRLFKQSTTSVFAGAILMDGRYPQEYPQVSKIFPDTGYPSNPSTPYRPGNHSNPTTPHRPRVFGHGTQWYNGNGNQNKQYQFHNHSYSLNYDHNHSSARGKFNGNSSDAIGPVVHKSAKLPLSFSESDFPPLNGNPNLLGNSEHNVNGDTSEPGVGIGLGQSDDRTPRRTGAENYSVWNGTNSLTFSRSNAPSPSPPPESKSLLTSLWLPLETTHSTGVIVGNANNNMSDSIDSSYAEVVLHTPETPDLELEIEGADGSASGVDTSPLTPGFSETPHTPRSAYISRLSYKNGNLEAQSGIELGKTNSHGSKIDLEINTPQSTNGNYIITQSHSRTNSTSKSVKVSVITKHSHRHHPSQIHDQERDEEESVMASPGDSPSASVSAFDRELFVGGLNVESWGDERLREVFAQYGPIEELRFIKPGYHAPAHRRGFAFIRYVNREDAQKAIHGQHMRLYDDHKIKVQLRDTHPNNRRSQWNYRGRARYNQGHRAEDTKKNSSSERVSSSPSKSHEEEILLPDDDVTPKYPCITDPLPEEEAALQNPLIQDKDREVPNHRFSPGTRFPDPTALESSPPSLSPPFKEPPRADLARRTTQSESGLRSPPPASNADALSTYAPSSTESAPPSSSYYAYPGIATNSWVPPYPLYAPSSHEFSHSGNTTVSSTQSVPSSDPWIGMYRNMLPAVPWFNPPPGVELTSAPLRPTGYFQRDGIFFPVYPPERLGQYMSTTSDGTDNGSGEEQKTQTASPPTAVSLTGPVTSTSPWPMAGPYPHQPYPSHLYPVPYTVPPHAMMVPPHMAHPSYQAQWISNPSYSQSVTQPHGYACGQQTQQQPQQHVPYVPLTVNGYPLYYQHPQQQSQLNNQSAYNPRNSLGVHDPTGVQQAPGQVMGQPGGIQPQVQQNYNQGKPGNGNRRDFGHHYKGNGNGGNGRPGRKGGISNNSSTDNGNGPTSGNAQPHPNNSANLTAGSRVIVNALPLQVTAA